MRCASSSGCSSLLPLPAWPKTWQALPMRAGLCLLALLVSTASARATSDTGAAPPLEKVLERARQAGKPALLDLAAVWCDPCKQLSKELETEAGQAALQP